MSASDLHSAGSSQSNPPESILDNSASDNLLPIITVVEVEAYHDSGVPPPLNSHEDFNNYEDRGICETVEDADDEDGTSHNNRSWAPTYLTNLTTDWITDDEDSDEEDNGAQLSDLEPFAATVGPSSQHHAPRRPPPNPSPPSRDSCSPVRRSSHGLFPAAS